MKLSLYEIFNSIILIELERVIDLVSKDIEVKKEDSNKIFDDKNFEEFIVENINQKTLVDLMYILESLHNPHFGEIYKATGTIKTVDHWYKFDLEGDEIEITGVNPRGDSSATISGKNLNTRQIKLLFFDKI